MSDVVCPQLGVGTRDELVLSLVARGRLSVQHTSSPRVVVVGRPDAAVSAPPNYEFFRVPVVPVVGETPPRRSQQGRLRLDVNERFDLVATDRDAHHMHPEALLAAIHGALRPQGVAVIGVLEGAASHRETSPGMPPVYRDGDLGTALSRCRLTLLERLELSEVASRVDEIPSGQRWALARGLVRYRVYVATRGSAPSEP